ncbi:MAG TPA: VOC family protein [Tepidisphaeraceae bacterium]|nr:VOC family protein [Tepidisphaeraceae bacterium]
MHPTFGNGKICYIVIPAADASRSAAFYETVFGWAIRRRDDGSMAFDDGVGEVSGTWVVGVPPATSQGLMVHIMVDDAEATVALIQKHGGKIVRPIGADHPEITAWFSDPAGNVLGIYQHGGRGKAEKKPAAG